MGSENCIEFFLEEFQKNEDKTVVIWKDQEYNYSLLLSRINYWRQKLANITVQRVVCLESDFSPETIALLFALIERNVIIVPMDIKQKDKNKKKYDIAQVQLIIRVHSEDDIELIEYNHTDNFNEFYKEIIDREVPGLVLFTSGSSGEPKAALHDFSKLLTKFHTKRNALRTINFLLFDHWGGLNTLFHVLSNEGTVVFLENRNPEYVAYLIEKYKIELLPASPTFLNMFLLSQAYENKDLSSLKIISYGSEPMPGTLLTRLHDQFPTVKLQQTYGLIELGVLRSKSESNDSLWVKIGGEGFQTRVVDGILQILSDSAMLGYLNAPSPFTEDGWFITGDSVEVKGEYFRILGRKSELINVGGEKVFPQEVENIIIEMPEILDVLVYGESNPITGMIVCAKVSYKGDKSRAEITKQIKEHCKQFFPSYKIPVKIVVTDEVFANERFKKRRK